MVGEHAQLGRWRAEERGDHEQLVEAVCLEKRGGGLGVVVTGRGVTAGSETVRREPPRRDDVGDARARLESRGEHADLEPAEPVELAELRDHSLERGDLAPEPRGLEVVPVLAQPREPFAEAVEGCAGEQVAELPAEQPRRARAARCASARPRSGP